MKRRLAVVVGLGFVFRLWIAWLVDRSAASRGSLCLFDDTRIYWELAGQLVRGQPYVVHQYGVPHWALRPPGYPVFLALCQNLLGSHTLPVRVVQCVLGAACIPLAASIGRSLTRGDKYAEAVALIAAAIVAFEPFTAASSAFLLSEALFIPLFMQLIAVLCRNWSRPAATTLGHTEYPLSLGIGMLAGATALVRPSILPFFVLTAIAWVVSNTAAWPRRGLLLSCAGIGMIALLGPWTARNHARTGALIPTASWLGASLYDGLNPDADGSSNMRFLDDPWIRSLSEVEQDRYLTRSAWEFAVGNPARAAELAIKKAGRFWSPWPNAKELSRPGVALASSLITVPIYVFVGIGAWIKRREPARLWLLLGPLFTTAVLHMVFVGSIRYRIPVLIPALPLAAIGLASIWWRTSSGGESLSSRAEPLDLP